MTHQQSDQVSIDTLYEMPVEALLTMNKMQLRDSLAKAELLCHWLRGIIALAAQREVTKECSGIREC